MNPHDGAVTLAHGGRAETLRFTWRTIDALQRDWGADYLQRVGEAIDRRQPAQMAELISRASSLSQEAALNWSPPLLAAAEALQLAWTYAWLGPVASDAAGASDPQDPPQARSIWSRLRFAQRFVRGSAGPNSGTLHRTAPAS